MPKFAIVRDDAGYASSIRCGEQYILHLVPGSELNEKNIAGIIDRLNGEGAQAVLLPEGHKHVAQAWLERYNALAFGKEDR